MCSLRSLGRGRDSDSRRWSSILWSFSEIGIGISNRITTSIIISSSIFILVRYCCCYCCYSCCTAAPMLTPFLLLLGNEAAEVGGANTRGVFMVLVVLVSLL